MKYRFFGTDDGQIVVYFHGAPGSPSEAETFQASAKEHGLNLICQDRFAIDPRLSVEHYFQALAADISQHAKGQRVDIIGFSIGAFVALQVARLIQGEVRSLHLVSPAAPLEGGDFLDSMAGKAVFRLAQKSPTLFKLLSHWQRLLAMASPKMLVKLLFASAVGGDKALVNEEGFQELIGQVLTDSFHGKVQGYVRDVQAYVAPWQGTLSEITVKTHLWHGAEDNWSPIAMSECLSRMVPGFVNLTRFEGLSHYSCLYAAAPEISRQLAHAGQ